MVTLRWKYKIQVDVEKTVSSAEGRGFSALSQEGQSRRIGEFYPLNEATIKSGSFGPNVKVLVAPTVTQIYISCEDSSNLDQLEQTVKDLEMVEQTLNEIVVFAPGETAKFGKDTAIPLTRDAGMLETAGKLKEIFHKALGDINGLALSEITAASLQALLGDRVGAEKRFGTLGDEFVRIQQDLIQMARKEGIKEADKWEDELKESTEAWRLVEAELASAKTPAEIIKVLRRYWTSLVSKK